MAKSQKMFLGTAKKFKKTVKNFSKKKLISAHIHSLIVRNASLYQQISPIVKARREHDVARLAALRLLRFSTSAVAVPAGVVLAGAPLLTKVRASAKLLQSYSRYFTRSPQSSQKAGASSGRRPSGAVPFKRARKKHYGRQNKISRVRLPYQRLLLSHATHYNVFRLRVLRSHKILRPLARLWSRARTGTLGITKQNSKPSRAGRAIKNRSRKYR